MLKTLSINDSNLTLLNNIYSNESLIHLALYKGENKVIKIIINNDALNNKIKKINLLKERLSSVEEVITAECFITDKNSIIGYMMPYINGEHLDLTQYKDTSIRINYLKEISNTLRKLHNLGVVNADFYNNIIINNDKLYFIDSDNFSIDSYPVDLKNIFLLIYKKNVKQFNSDFDNYLLNIYTICTLKGIIPQHIYSIYKKKKSSFNFKDKEINNIFYKTMNLDNCYNEELIIDKINSTKDLKKIKVKLF